MNTKLTISKSMYAKLSEDKTLFNFKTDNDFYTSVIINTYEYENQTKKIESIKNKLLDGMDSIKNNSIIKSIESHKNDDNFKKELTEIAILLSSSLSDTVEERKDEIKHIYVRDTSKTNNALEDITNETAYIRAATLFKTLLKNYLSYPLFIRERIIYSKIYNKLIEIKKSGLCCKLTTKNAIFEYEIYDIVSGNEGYHYYVIGYGKTSKLKRKILCFKLSTILNLNKSFSPINITVDEENIIKDKIKTGVEWVSDKFITDCQVFFDEVGLERYEDLYKDRPIGEILDSNKNIMSFSCGRTQLLNYLKQFGCHAIVLNNDSLRKSLATHYKKANDAYNGENEEKNLRDA